MGAVIVTVSVSLGDKDGVGTDWLLVSVTFLVLEMYTTRAADPVPTITTPFLKLWDLVLVRGGDTVCGAVAVRDTVWVNVSVANSDLDWDTKRTDGVSKYIVGDALVADDGDSEVDDDAALLVERELDIVFESSLVAEMVNVTDATPPAALTPGRLVAVKEFESLTVLVIVMVCVVVRLFVTSNVNVSVGDTVSCLVCPEREMSNVVVMVILLLPSRETEREADGSSVALQGDCVYVGDADLASVGVMCVGDADCESDGLCDCCNVGDIGDNDGDWLCSCDTVDDSVKDWGLDAEGDAREWLKDTRTTDKDSTAVLEADFELTLRDADDDEVVLGETEMEAVKLPWERLGDRHEGVCRTEADWFCEAEGDALFRVFVPRIVSSSLKVAPVRDLVADWSLESVKVRLDVRYSVDEKDSMRVFVVVGDAGETVTVAVYVSAVGVTLAVRVFFGTLAVIVVVMLWFEMVKPAGDRVGWSVRVKVLSGEKEMDGRDRVTVTVLVSVSESIDGDSNADFSSEAEVLTVTVSEMYHDADGDSSVAVNVMSVDIVAGDLVIDGVGEFAEILSVLVSIGDTSVVGLFGEGDGLIETVLDAESCSEFFDGDADRVGGTRGVAVYDVECDTDPKSFESVVLKVVEFDTTADTLRIDNEGEGRVWDGLGDGDSDGDGGEGLGVVLWLG
jgi:predicted small integral membrane protein